MIEDYMVPMLRDEREAAEERMVREQIEETEARLLREMAERYGKVLNNSHSA